jgi:hypothetical protein
MITGRIPLKKPGAGLLARTERKKPATDREFPGGPASVSGFTVRYPVFCKSGKFIIFLYPFSSTGTSLLSAPVGTQDLPPGYRIFLF